MAPSLQRAHIITVTTGKQRFACLHAHVLHPEIQGCTSKSTFEIQRRKSCLCTKARAMFCILPEPRLLAGMQPKMATKRQGRNVQTVSSGFFWCRLCFWWERVSVAKTSGRHQKTTATAAAAAPARQHTQPGNPVYFLLVCTTCSSSISQLCRGGASIRDTSQLYCRVADTN